MDPVFVGVPDDGLGSRTDDQLFVELGCWVDVNALAVFRSLETIVGHHGALLGEACHVLSLTREETLGDEHREICVLYTCLLKHLVELLLHLLPDGVAVWFDDHTTAYWRQFSEVGFHYQVVIPLAVVLGTLGQIL